MASKWELAKEQANIDITYAAIAEFAEKGYSGATIKSIANRAVVSNGLVSKYFGTRENLMLSLMDEIRLEDIYKDFTESNCREVLCRYFNAIRELQQNQPHLFRFFLVMMVGTDTPISAYEKMMQSFPGSLLEQGISRGQAAGELPNEITPDKFYALLFTTTFIQMHLHKHVGLQAPNNEQLLNMIGWKSQN